MRTLIEAERIRRRVQELGSQLARDYADKPLTLLGVLTGSVVFLSDLIRQIRLPVQVGVVQASSYRGRATTPGELHISLNLVPDIRDRHVVLVDDIYDTGQTLARLVDELQTFEPRSVRSVVLLKKAGRREVALEPDYAGFDIPDEFVVGYGLDFNGDFRHLPEIASLDPSDIKP